MKIALIVIFCLSAICSAAEPKVMIHLLDHTGKSSKDKKFWIVWSESWRVIEQTKIIEGDEAQTIIDQLKVSLDTSESMHFCGHDPIYGIVARDKDGKTIITSLCFKCSTWVKPGIRGRKGKRLNINGKRGKDNPLCLVLRKHIELPKVLLKQESEQGAAGNPLPAE